MAQEQFSLDPLQTQLVKPVTSMTAPAIAGPRPTGLSKGLGDLSRAMASAAQRAKEIRFEEDKITAGLYAAKGEVAPGLISQEALLHNYNLLDENYANRVLKQVEVYDNNDAATVSNSLHLTSEQKAIDHASFITNIKQLARQSITTNGEALGKLMVSLDGYQYKWNHDVAQFEKIQRMKTITENVITSTQNHLRQGGAITKSWLKEKEDTINKGQLTHHKIQVDGKWYRTATNIDANKAVFASVSSTVQDLYLNNSHFNRQFRARIKDYFLPLARIEESLIASGKQDVIGDDKTLMSMITDHDKGIKDIVDADIASTKAENTSFYSRWITAKIEGGFPWEARDGFLFNTKFGTDAATWTTKAKKQIDSVKRGLSSQEYSEGLDLLYNGQLRSKPAIDAYSSYLSNNLNEKSRSNLMTLSSAKEAEYTHNVSTLTDSVGLSLGAVLSEVKNVHLRDSLSAALGKRGKTMFDVLNKEWLESWLLVKNSVKWPHQVKRVFDDVKEFMILQKSAVLRASSDRTFLYAGEELIGGRTDKFTPDELGKFTLTATNKLLKHLEKIAEWTTDKKGNMIRVKPPSSTTGEE